MRPKNDEWKYGEKSTLAKKSGVAFSMITRLTDRTITVSRDSATKLAKACKAMGIPISREDWIYNKTTANPRFKATEETEDLKL